MPASTLQEFIALAKKNLGRLNDGSAGNGGISHLVPEMFKQATGTFIVHIPCQGSALAVTSRERNPALPDTPTMIEAGLKGFEVVGFYGVLAPAATPKAVVDRLSAAIKAALESPDVRSKMVAHGADPAFQGADAPLAFA